MVRSLVYAKEAGYENVELWYSDLPDWVGGTIQETLDDLSLHPYSIHLPKFLVSFNDKQFGDTVYSAFSFIETLGLKVAVLHLPQQSQLSGKKWAKRYNVLLNEAEHANCMLTFENVPYIKDVDIYILDEVQKHRSLGITVDMEFMYLHGTDLNWLTTAFGDCLVNIHFRDSDGNLVGKDGRRHYLNPGDGKIDLRAMVKILHNASYKGPLTVEVSHRQRENIVRAKQYAEDCLRNL
jgi:sugar phosphate isomerase/epimerase